MFPVTNMSPLLRFKTKPTMPTGISFSRLAIGTDLPKPKMRMSSQPTVPISNDMPMKCSISQIGHTQS